MPVQHGDGLIIGRFHHGEACLACQLFEGLGTDHVHLALGLTQLLHGQCAGRLGAGEHLVCGGGKTQIRKMIRHCLRGAGGIVGHVDHFPACQTFRGTVHWAAAFKNGAV